MKKYKDHKSKDPNTSMPQATEFKNNENNNTNRAAFKDKDK